MTPLRLVLNVILVGILCYVSNEIGFAHKIPPHNISVLWPTSAILLSILLVTRPRHWWAYVLAAYFSSVIRDARAGFPVEVFFFIGAGLLEILGAAFIIRRYLDPFRMFDSLRGLVLYLGIAVMGAPLVSAFVSAFAGGMENYWLVWRGWFLSDGMAQLALTPAILSWITLARNGLGTFPIARRIEAAVLAPILGLVCFLAFTGIVQGGHGVPALVYLPLPLLLWAAVRFGPVGVNTSLLIVACMSISGAVHGRGPFVFGNEGQGVFSLQLFLVALSVPLMLLAAVIHETRDKAQELRESEARFRSMADTSPVMIWMSDLDRKREYFSKPWLDFTGRTFEQELGDGWVEGVHSDDRQHCLKVYTESFDARRPFEMEYRLRRKDGHHRWVLDCGVPRFMPDGSFAGYIGSCLDIAGRKDAELKLQEQRAELVHVSRLAIVGELTASIAHEINQPLGAILSNADAAEMLLDRENPRLDEVRQILADIRKDDLRASEVIGRMRTLLRKREVEMLPLNLNEAAAEVVRLIANDAHRRGVTVDAEFDNTLPVVQGDKVHLQQVLLNLIINGMEAMTETPELKRRLAIRTRLTPDGDAEVLVTDAGHGIPSDRLPRLFESFYTTKQEGMGLGLSIVRSIIEAHRGSIWAENNFNGGAKFRFILPAKAGEGRRHGA